MISTVLVEISRWVPLLFWVACAAAAATAWVLHRFRRRTVLFALSGVALVAVLALTVTPDGEPTAGGCTVQFSVPLQGIDTLANVGMMLPLALFLAVATRRPLPVLGAVSALSAVIEAAQSLVPVLGRRCDTDDWLMNTVGAAMGALVALTILALERRRVAAASRSMGETATASRGPRA